eukprot:3846450-Prymnesium_polylepis.1
MHHYHVSATNDAPLPHVSATNGPHVRPCQLASMSGSESGGAIGSCRGSSPSIPPKSSSSTALWSSSSSSSSGT